MEKDGQVFLMVDTQPKEEEDEMEKKMWSLFVTRYYIPHALQEKRKRERERLTGQFWMTMYCLYNSLADARFYSRSSTSFYDDGWSTLDADALVGRLQYQRGVEHLWPLATRSVSSAINYHQRGRRGGGLAASALLFHAFDSQGFVDCINELYSYKYGRCISRCAMYRWNVGQLSSCAAGS